MLTTNLDTLINATASEGAAAAQAAAQADVVVEDTFSFAGAEAGLDVAGLAELSDDSLTVGAGTAADLGIDALGQELATLGLDSGTVLQLDQSENGASLGFAQDLDLSLSLLS